jgi:hypothetical protein
MLWVYAGTNLLECNRLARSALPPKYIDVSKTRACDLFETLTTIYTHHPGASIYLGFLDPILMIAPPHEAACRAVFRTCTVAMVTSNPLILPYSWKNGTSRLIIVGDTKTQDASDTKTLNDCSTSLLQNEA